MRARVAVVAALVLLGCPGCITYVAHDEIVHGSIELEARPITSAIACRVDFEAGSGHLHRVDLWVRVERGGDLRFFSAGSREDRLTAQGPVTEGTTLPAARTPCIVTMSGADPERLRPDAMACLAGLDGRVAGPAPLAADDVRDLPRVHVKLGEHWSTVLVLLPPPGGRVWDPDPRDPFRHEDWSRGFTLENGAVHSTPVGAYVLFGLAVPFTVALDVALAPFELLGYFLIVRPLSHMGPAR